MASDIPVEGGVTSTLEFTDPDAALAASRRAQPVNNSSPFRLTRLVHDTTFIVAPPAGCDDYDVTEGDPDQGEEGCVDNAFFSDFGGPVGGPLYYQPQKNSGFSRIDLPSVAAPKRRNG